MGTISVTTKVKITDIGQNKFQFAYDGRFFDSAGNCDFSVPGAKGNTINLTFRIDAGSVPGIKFKSAGREAIWIVKKNPNNDPKACPSGPYQGDIFLDFAVSADGSTLTLTDLNNDSGKYRYGLRFDLNGKTIEDDPDATNAGGN